jgi:hypothetical protein
MLSQRVVIGLLPLLFGGSVFAQAACPCGAGTRVVEPALTTLLAGKTVCAALGAETWQEFHGGGTAAGGPLSDWKRGPGHSVDPSAVVGSWSIVNVPDANAESLVKYQYTGGGVYLYSVCQNGASVTFCGAPYGGRNIAGATLRQGQVSCGG